MKRRLELVVVGSLLAMAVMPVFAQETQSTTAQGLTITYPKTITTGKKIEVKVDYKDVAEGQKLSCDLHWNKTENRRGGFNATGGAPVAISGTGSHTFKMTPKAKTDIGSINVVAYATAGGWAERTKLVRSPKIPVAVGAAAPAAPRKAPPKPKTYPPGEPGKPILTAAQLAAAPKPAVLEKMGLKTTLIDYIDCTNPQDPHEMKDLGTSKVTEGKAGKYRVTAPHNHAFFAYRYHTAGVDQPVLIVVEYPDDANRIMNFITHDSTRPYRAHISFSTEAGVYTGGAYPLSNKMQYFTQIVWPQDQISPLIVGNNNRIGAPAAASKIWVYKIDEMPAAKIACPDAKAPRQLDMFFPLLFLAQRDNFGWKSPRSIEHIVDYSRYLGVNRITAMVYANQSWGAMITVKAWDANDFGALEDVLKRMDTKGAKVGFIAGIVADGMYGDTKAGGKKIADMEPAEAEKVLKAGFKEIVDRYGKYKSFKGLALCSMEADGFTQMLLDKELLGKMVEYIHSLRPDLEVQTFAGNAYLQSPHMHKKNKNNVPVREAYDVIVDWEKKGGNWTEAMGEVVLQNWKEWNKEPAMLRKVAPKLKVYEQREPDDFTLSDAYLHIARTGPYFDLCRAQNVSAAADTPYAGIFGTFMESWYGLKKGKDFWYNKAWLAPEYNPAGPFTRAAWANAMANNDRLGISAGSWCCKYFGTEPWMRSFAEAFGSLPPVQMEAVKSTIDARVVVRWVEYNGKRYLYAVSRIPFAQKATVDGKSVDLEPFGLVAWNDAGKGEPKVDLAANKEYVAWLKEKFDAFEKLCAETKTLDAEAVPAAYANALKDARELLGKGQLYHAELTCPYGMQQIIAYRRSVLAPPKMIAAKGDKGNAYKYSCESLQDHVYFPTGWKGDEDLSASLTFRNDGEYLYVTPVIKDNVANAKDGVTVRFSKANWRNWRGMQQKFDGPGLTVKSGQESKIALSKLGVQPGGSVGFLMTIADVDDEANHPVKHSWAMKQALMCPNQPNFAPWNDARVMGELVIEK